MKVFHSELVQNYDTYSFGYAVYALREKKDLLHEIYEKGFLPYSGMPEIKDHLYMARSIRVDLKRFELNSENRRIIKKVDNNIQRQVIPIKEFDIENKEFLKFCQTYFREWHGIDIKTKLYTVLHAGFITDIVVYTKDEAVQGFVFLVQDDTMSHYWFSFYDMSLIRTSFGLWMMTKEIIESKNCGHKYMYLGTGYGDKAMYKTNFSGLEYWNGDKWIADAKALKNRAKTDIERSVHIKDEWQMSSFTQNNGHKKPH